MKIEKKKCVVIGIKCGGEKKFFQIRKLLMMNIYLKNADKSCLGLNSVAFNSHFILMLFFFYIKFIKFFGGFFNIQSIMQRMKL